MSIFILCFFQIVLGVVKFVVVCLGGFVLGVLAGAGTAILTRFTNKVKGE